MLLNFELISKRAIHSFIAKWRNQPHRNVRQLKSMMSMGGMKNNWNYWFEFWSDIWWEEEAFAVKNTYKRRNYPNSCRRGKFNSPDWYFSQVFLSVMILSFNYTEYQCKRWAIVSRFQSLLHECSHFFLVLLHGWVIAFILTHCYLEHFLSG